MQPTQTGIATALALVVVIMFFVVPGLWPFGQATAPAEEEVAGNTIQLATTTMPREDATELSVTDIVVGSGTAAAAGDAITVNYVGALTNGTIFDASANHPESANGYTFPLGAGQVIAGWDQGLVGMKVGGKRRLVIPPALAYGDRAIGEIIPANSTLVFEVELVNVQKAAP